MGPFGRRKKKLILAFHFQFSDRAGWECETCRRSGLAERRRCAYLGFQRAERPVWVRNGAAAFCCPKSEATAESLSLLEEWQWWRAAGRNGLLALPAKVADAFAALEECAKAEEDGGRRSPEAVRRGGHGG